MFNGVLLVPSIYQLDNNTTVDSKTPLSDCGDFGIERLLPGRGELGVAAAAADAAAAHRRRRRPARPQRLVGDAVPRGRLGLDLATLVNGTGCFYQFFFLGFSGFLRSNVCTSQ